MNAQPSPQVAFKGDWGCFPNKQFTKISPMMRINSRNRKKMTKSARREIEGVNKLIELYCAICHHSEDISTRTARRRSASGISKRSTLSAWPSSARWGSMGRAAWRSSTTPGLQAIPIYLRGYWT